MPGFHFQRFCFHWSEVCLGIGIFIILPSDSNVQQSLRTSQLNVMNLLWPYYVNTGAFLFHTDDWIDIMKTVFSVEVDKTALGWGWSQGIWGTQSSSCLPASTELLQYFNLELPSRSLCDDGNVLYVHCPIRQPVFSCGYGAFQRGCCEWGTQVSTLILSGCHLNLSSHMRLVATILDSFHHGYGQSVVSWLDLSPVWNHTAWHPKARALSPPTPYLLHRTVKGPAEEPTQIKAHWKLNDRKSEMPWGPSPGCVAVTPVEELLCVRHCFETSAGVSLFNPLQDSMREEVPSVSFYRGAHWSLLKLHNPPWTPRPIGHCHGIPTP